MLRRVNLNRNVAFWALLQPNLGHQLIQFHTLTQAPQIKLYLLFIYILQPCHSIIPSLHLRSTEE
jgi:hypothetical protein